MLAPPFPAAATALALCEAFTGQALIARAWTDTLPAHGAWQRLAGAPVTAIDSVVGLSVSDNGFALPADTYAIDIDAAGEGWVRGSAAIAAGRLRVGYAAGIAAEYGGLPAPLAQGVVLLAAHLFEARASGGAPPAAVAALWRPWRRLRLESARRSA